jgi:hypothetical protein
LPSQFVVPLTFTYKENKQQRAISGL